MSKSIQVNRYRYENRIEKFAELFESDVHEDCDEYQTTFNNRFGSGIIRGINFEFGVGVMMMDMKIDFDLEIHYAMGRRHPIQFIYNTGAPCSMESEELKDMNLAENESLIFAPKGDSDYYLKFRRKKHYSLIVVEVTRFLFLRKIECDLDTIPLALQNMFRDTVGEDHFCYQTTSQPIMISMIKELMKSGQSGLERKLLIESKSLKLITTLIKRFRLEEKMLKGGYKFSETDIQTINHAKNIIIDQIDTPPSVNQLSIRVGMNPSKLQKGFHLLFSKSIKQFVISTRMHIALNMLEHDAISISEAADKVGYTNKGHFSQLFKKEFGILPSEL